MTRDEAIAALGGKTRKYIVGALVAIPATPVAVLLLQGLAVLSGAAHVHSWTGLLPGQLFWTPLTWLIVAISSALLVRRAHVVRKRLEPIILSGTELPCVVTSARTSSYSKSGVTMTVLDATFDLGNGRVLAARAEEPVGTPLPAATVGARATAWVHGTQAVFAVGEGFLEGSA